MHNLTEKNPNYVIKRFTSLLYVCHCVTSHIFLKAQTNYNNVHSCVWVLQSFQRKYSGGWVRRRHPKELQMQENVFNAMCLYYIAIHRVGYFQLKCILRIGILFFIAWQVLGLFQGLRKYWRMGGCGTGNAFVERIVKPVRKNGPPLTKLM